PNWFVYEAFAASFEIQPPGPPRTEDVEQLARSIEAWAQERGPDTAVWFQAPLGVKILVSPDPNKTHRWLSSRFLPIWGSAFLSISIESRLEGIRMALNDGAQAQAEP
ncbi:MAG TPA: hypothetical protein VFV38_16840, partial [Ktedonobacteraceae bacterium]|nr:hypothetical protein [Ktedonobacteraceae bacterium]